MKSAVLAAMIGLMTFAVGEALAEGAEPEGAQFMPQGEGREIALRTCSGCHSLEIVAAKRTDGAGWSETLEAMRGRGAEVADEEVGELAAYLTRSFPPETGG